MGLEFSAVLIFGTGDPGSPWDLFPPGSLQIWFRFTVSIKVFTYIYLCCFIIRLYFSICQGLFMRITGFYKDFAWI